MVGKKGQAMTFGTAPKMIMLFVLIGMVLGAGVIGLSSFRDSSRSTNTEARTITALNSTAVSFKTSGTTQTVYSCATPTSVTNGTNLQEIKHFFTFVTGTTCTATLFNNSFNNAAVVVTYVATLDEASTDVLDNSISGGTNMSAQLPTVGTILGVGLILVVVIGVFAYFAMGKSA